MKRRTTPARKVPALARVPSSRIVAAVLWAWGAGRLDLLGLAPRPAQKARRA